jgi:hypothetical protein
MYGSFLDLGITWEVNGQLQDPTALPPAKEPPLPAGDEIGLASKISETSYEKREE